VDGTGDWERGVDDEEVLAGGPFDQADFDGSWVEVFGAVVVADLLILDKKWLEGKCRRGPRWFADEL
jgi:hypothetical protein